MEPRELDQFLRNCAADGITPPPERGLNPGAEHFSYRRRLATGTDTCAPSFNYGGSLRQALTNAAKASRSIGQLRAAIADAESHFGEQALPRDVTYACRKASLSPLVDQDSHWSDADSRQLMG